MPSTPVQIDKHQPERRRQGTTTLYHGGGCCCCCCCCCLHTLGSIVGAAMAPTMGQGQAGPTALTYYYDDETGETVADVRKPGGGLSSVTVFWWVLCVLIFVGLVIPILINPKEPYVIGIAGIFILLGFPVLQLASAVITLVIFAVWQRTDTSYQLKLLGKITLGTFLGAMLGLLVMALLLGGFFLVLRR